MQDTSEVPTDKNLHQNSVYTLLDISIKNLFVLKDLYKHRTKKGYFLFFNLETKILMFNN